MPTCPGTVLTGQSDSSVRASRSKASRSIYLRVQRGTYLYCFESCGHVRPACLAERSFCSKSWYRHFLYLLSFSCIGHNTATTWSSENGNSPVTSHGLNKQFLSAGPNCAIVVRSRVTLIAPLKQIRPSTKWRAPIMCSHQGFSRFYQNRGRAEFWGPPHTSVNSTLSLLKSKGIATNSRATDGTTGCAPKIPTAATSPIIATTSTPALDDGSRGWYYLTSLPKTSHHRTDLVVCTTPIQGSFC